MPFLEERSWHSLMMEKHLEIGSVPSNSGPGPEMAKLEVKLGREKGCTWVVADQAALVHELGGDVERVGEAFKSEKLPHFPTKEVPRFL